MSAKFYSVDQASAMAAPIPSLAFNTDFAPETGRSVEVAPGVVRITAPNEGPYTFKGTNTFLIGNDTVFVVDPGPDEPSHLDALRSAIGGRRIGAVLLTHTHKDHSLLAPKLAAATGAPLWCGGRHRLSRPLRPLEVNPIGRDSDWALVPDRALVDGEIIAGDVADIEVIATPGHCANHLAFGLVGTGRVLTGDHVMGWNSTLIAVPDGSMADYLASLDRLVARPYQHYLPAHGGGIDDGQAYALALKAHREMRNRQVVEAVQGGATRIGEIRRALYPELAPTLWAAAQMTLEAHAEFLAAEGLIAMRRGLLGTRLYPVAR